MLAYFKLEHEQIRMRPFIKASIYLTIFQLLLTYFISIVSRVENDVIFQSYENIFKFISLIGTVSFSILAAIMFQTFILKEFNGTNSTHYQSKRSFLMRTTMITSFTVISMLLSHLFSSTIFSISETIFPIVSGTLSIQVVANSYIRLISLAFLVGSCGIISMGIGFMLNKSLTVIIVVSLLFIDLFQRAENGGVSIYVLEIFSVLASIVVLFILLAQLNNLQSNK